jgi:hypothetical protein
MAIPTSRVAMDSAVGTARRMGIEFMVKYSPDG